jgi:hypothetical protein
VPIGSETVAKTIGMVRVCRSKAAVVGVLCERMRWGCSATSSFANCCIAGASDVAAQRMSMRMLRPSTHPSVWSPSRNAATRACAGGVALGKPHQHPDAPHLTRLLSSGGERREQANRRERRGGKQPCDPPAKDAPGDGWAVAATRHQHVLSA